jgi:hypothetical protein
MASRDVTVTVRIDEQDQRLLADAADCAGMTLQDYLGWNIELLAQQCRPGPAQRGHRALPPRRRIPVVVDESEDQAWTSSFTERLDHRTGLYHEH